MIARHLGFNAYSNTIRIGGTNKFANERLNDVSSGRMENGEKKSVILIDIHVKDVRFTIVT